ncbi:hypothetical protein JOF53_008284 [Crossiella equi]|uniref:Uncharacterized protein n=1 Tax=Crossiella equi TaxID=130796 RepID=A0ABS5ASP4_9PSEU|nr:hypothetical protein [Crossiella equi]MBP2479412.1 hypothetical protein [Crossiella equi]
MCRAGTPQVHPTGPPEDLRLQVRVRAVQDLGAECRNDVVLGRCGGGEHARTEVPGQGERGLPHSPDGGVREHDLTGGQPP